MNKEIKEPEHYIKKDCMYQCWDLAGLFNFVLGNVIKYIWRSGQKEDNSAYNDYSKALVYLENYMSSSKSCRLDSCDLKNAINIITYLESCDYQNKDNIYIYKMLICACAEESASFVIDCCLDNAKNTIEELIKREELEETPLSKRLK